MGDGGGCASASACAERARAFLHLVAAHGFEGAGFWHWAGAPAAFWDVLFERARASAGVALPQQISTLVQHG